MTLLTRFQLQVDDKEIALRYRKSAALLAFLSLQPGMREARERLQSVLWSEAPPDPARASLRQELYQLNLALKPHGIDMIRSDRNAVWLLPEAFATDIDAVMSAARAATAHPLLLAQPNILDAFLKDLEDVDPAFRDWVTAVRAEAKAKILEQLTHGLARAATAHDREALARAIVTIEPIHEPAVRTIMQCRAEAGDIAGALKAYKLLWDLLDDAFEVEPGAETQQLLVAIRLSQPPSEPEPLLHPEPPQPRLEVMRHVADGRAIIAAQVPGNEAVGGMPDATLRAFLASPNARLISRTANQFVIQFDTGPTAAKTVFSTNLQVSTAMPGTPIQIGAAIEGEDGSAPDLKAAMQLASQLAAHAGPGQFLATEGFRETLHVGPDADVHDLGLQTWELQSGPLRTFSLHHPDHGPSPTAASPDLKPSIAVIPFWSKSEGLGNTVGEILAEHLINALATSNEVSVISRLSTRALAGRRLQLNLIAQLLNAPSYIITGDIDTLPDGRLAIRAELVESRSGNIVLGHTVAVRLADLANDSAAIVEDIVAAFTARIFTRELERTQLHPLRSVENYTLLFAAVNLLHRWSPQSFLRAKAILDELIARIPAHPLPHAWLARLYVWRVNQGWSSDIAADAADAAASAARAIDADPTCSLALTSHAWVNLHMLKRFDRAADLFDQAVECNPNNSLAWLLKGVMHSFQGQGQLAVAGVERAKRLSPLDPRRGYYDALAVAAYLSADEFDKAVTHAQQSLKINRNFTSALRALAVAQSLSGRMKEARNTVEELRRLEPALTTSQYLNRHPAGDNPTGRRWADALRKAGLPE